MRCLQEVFKTSLRRLWKTKNRYDEDVSNMASRHVLMTSLRRLEDQQIFAGKLQKQPPEVFCIKGVLNPLRSPYEFHEGKNCFKYTKVL